MEFSSLGFVQAVQGALNSNPAFNAASRCSDVKVCLRDKLERVECAICMFEGEADHHIPDQDVLDTIAAIPTGLGEGEIARRIGHLIRMEDPERPAEACLGFLRRRSII